MFFTFQLIILAVLIPFVINYLCQKYNFLIYAANEKHKENFENIIVNSGGLILFVYFSLLYFFYFDIEILDIKYFVFFTFVFLIGLASDTIMTSAKLRLFLLSIIAVIFIYYSDNYVWDFKFNLINDFFLKYKFFAILFTAFCLIILVNGINFIDGVHGLAILYCTNVILALTIFNVNYLEIDILINKLFFLLPLLIILLIQNLRERLFFGDSGSYLIGVILGIFIVNQTNTSNLSFPFFYANLLIYPAYEVFFSIFRKIITKKNPIQPDKLHIHHLFQKFYQSKGNSFKISKIYSGLSINLLVLIFISLALLFSSNKYFLIINIFIFSLVYTIIYLFLRRLKFN